MSMMNVEEQECVSTLANKPDSINQTEAVELQLELISALCRDS